MKTIIKKEIENILKDFDLPKVDFSLEHPNNSDNGDYSSNVSIIASKKLDKTPKESADMFKEALQGKIKYVERIETLNGFLNFYLSQEFFSEKIKEIEKLKDRWGENDIEKGNEVLIEYSSPNLFKELHIGNLVGTIIGQSISRIFEMSGAKVRRITFPSDIGLTVAKCVWGIKKKEADLSDIGQIGKAYIFASDAYLSDKKAKEEIDEINKEIYFNPSDELKKIRDSGKETSLKHIEKLSKYLDLKFDTTIFESDASSIGVQEVSSHIDDGIFEKDAGAVIYRGEKHGLHTRVFINSLGIPTYEAKDVGNFNIKQKKYPKWNRSIIVTGSEQGEYLKVVFEAIKEVFKIDENKKMEHIKTGVLTLENKKMSSRKGDILTADFVIKDLIDTALTISKNMRVEDVESLSEKIAIAALKYRILSQNVGSNILFEKEKAFSFEGDSGPYIQYTYARIVSVLNKAKENGIKASIKNCPESAYEIERFLYQFPEIVEISLRKRSPHFIISYITKLASLFNSFYSVERISDPDDKMAGYKVALSQAVQQTIKNGLFLVGIHSPEKM